jgi:hypothetical protein
VIKKINHFFFRKPLTIGDRSILSPTLLCGLSAKKVGEIKKVCKKLLTISLIVIGLSPLRDESLFRRVFVNRLPISRVGAGMAAKCSFMSKGALIVEIIRAECINNPKIELCRTSLLSPAKDLDRA